MSYIIVWRNGHRDPHVQTDGTTMSSQFLETFSSYEDAKESADNTLQSEGPNSPWYFDYAIYKEVDN
jgi:hypothetical protein